MIPALGLLSMLIRENWIAGDLQRVPEELLVMDTQDQVAAWHEQGADDGPILPIYHLNALACSRLAPAGGTVVDLGCGSGQYAAYLARCRPDLKIVGLDLSEPMVATGNAALRQAGLAHRVELRMGDMTAFADRVPGDTVLISSVFSLHHLPTIEYVEQCFREIGALRRSLGCALWLFDLARPRHASTARAYPQVFTPEAPEAFCQDSTNSLVAAYSHAELGEAVDRVFGPVTVKAVRARFLPLYQAFWANGTKTPPGGADPTSAIVNKGLASFRASSQYSALRAILPGLPR